MSERLEPKESKQSKEQSNEQFSSEEDSPHFRFDEGGMEKRGRQTGKYLGKINTARNFNGYTRPSDYVTYDSDQLTIANNEQEKVACFRKIEISDTKDENDSRRKSISYRKSTRMEEPMDVEPIKKIVQPDTEASKQVMQTANAKSNQPFVIEGISSVKKVVPSNERKSEKYILEVLSGMNFQSVPSYQGSARKYSQFIDRMIEPYKETEEQRKEKQIKEKQIKEKEDFERRYGLNQDKKVDGEVKIKKRVTINQNGKIKRPTDNLTDDSYEEIVPAELKRRASSGLKRERPTDVIEEQQQQVISNKQKPKDQFVFTMPASTQMVFTLPELEKKNLDKKKTKKKNKQKEQRVSPSQPKKSSKSKPKSQPKSKSRSKSRPKSQANKDVKAKASSKSKSKDSSKENFKGEAKIKSKSPSNQSAKQSKSPQVKRQASKEKKSKKDQKKQKEEKGKIEKLESSVWEVEPPSFSNTFVSMVGYDVKAKKAEKKKEIEPKKKVIKIEDEVIVKQASPQKVNDRPQRFRVTRLKYWQCQRLVYSKKTIELTDHEAFFRMIGMKNIQKIGGATTVIRPQEVRGKFNLRPRQKVQAAGFSLKEMEREWRDIRPKKLIITRMGRKDSIMATVDEFRKESLNEPLVLKEGEEFTLQNPTNNMVTINLVLE